MTSDEKPHFKIHIDGVSGGCDDCYFMNGGFNEECPEKENGALRCVGKGGIGYWFEKIEKDEK